MSKHFFILILIIFLGVFLRIYQITSIPPGLYPDEAINGNNGWEAVETKSFKVFYPENNGREGLFINLIGIFLKIFNYHHYSIRLVSVFVGILTILGIYLLAKEIFKDNLIAILSTFFLAVSFWHLNFSRIGFRGILLPFFISFGFYFYFLAKRKKSKILWFLSGTIIGLGFHSYISYRVIVILLFVLFLKDVVERKEIQQESLPQKTHFYFFNLKISKIRPIVLTSLTFSKQIFCFYLIFFFGIFLAALPLGIYFLNHYSDFISRASGVSIFKSQSPVRAFFESLVKHLLMFNFSGDCNFRHHLSCFPQLLNFDYFFFLVGIFALIKSKKISKEAKIFVFSGFFIFLLPSVLTCEGIPHSIRSIGCIPFIYLLVGFGAKKFFEILKNLKVRYFFMFFILTSSFFLTFYFYFYKWARSKNVKDAFSYSYFEISNYLNSLPKERKKYVVCNVDGVLVRDRSSNEFLPMPCQSIMFLTNSFLKKEAQKRNIYYLSEEKYYKNKEFFDKSGVVVKLNPDKKG